ncbi:hypothetical protein Tco_0660675 [Tanacetum coccineum]
MNVSTKSFSSSCVQQVCVTSVFFGWGFLPLDFDLAFSTGDDSDCEACVGECDGKKALGFETNGRDIEKNSQDIETNGWEIETYDRGIEMYWRMKVLRVMGSLN